MRTNYKFWFIKRDDEGYITETTVRFFEGDYETKVIDGEEKQVYVHKKRLKATNGDLDHLNADYVLESSSKEAIYYDVRNFGKIKTDEELVAFLNKEIAKDKGRTPINEQLTAP